jgi:tetratricopeptide (TPR) repeat protein
MKLMPGVRLNFGKDSIGMSFGVPGARYTINSKGRRTVTAGIPGTGIYDVTTLSSGRRSSAESDTWEETDPVKPPAPGLFASKSENELYRLIYDVYGPEATLKEAVDVVSAAYQLKAQYPKAGAAADLIAILHGVRDDATSEAAYKRAVELWPMRGELFTNKLVRKYFKGIYPGVSITRGIFTNGSYDVQALGFIVSEVLQLQGKVEEAVKVLGEMTPTQLVGISLADIEIGAGDFDGAIETTEDIENEDDATAMMLVLRGIAFREKGLEEAALECFKRSIAKKDRSEGVIHRGLYERAMTYKKMGKNAAATKDLEKILVDDPTSKEVLAALRDL